jgi:hypothetical protein
LQIKQEVIRMETKEVLLLIGWVFYCSIVLMVYGNSFFHIIVYIIAITLWIMVFIKPNNSLSNGKEGDKE